MLAEASDADFAALLVGTAPLDLRLADTEIAGTEVLQMLRALANDIRPHFSPSAWLIVEDGEVVGMCSLTRVPANGAIDIGYGIAPSKHGIGVAGRAISQLLEWCRSDSRVTSVKAETSVDNLPSQRVLERHGFSRVGERCDQEDGNLICWAKDTAA